MGRKYRRGAVRRVSKKEPFENEPPEFAKAMESAFRSIVADKKVGQAEFLTLVAAGYVAASCPGVLRAD